MSDIPTDVFDMILRRVPVESLFHFRSVCKSWRRIIDNPSFAKSHINRGLSNNNWLIISNKNNDFFLLPMRDMITSRSQYVEATNVKTRIVNHQVRVDVRNFLLPSCNGLFLFSTMQAKHYLVLVVWNPFTGQCLEIPQCDLIEKWGARDWPCCGIGYDEANDDYKVVRIIDRETFIYSVSLDSWRKVEGLSGCDIESSLNGAFAYGSLHWIAYSNNYGVNALPDDDLLGCVVAFDLSKETYTKIPFPSGIPKSNRLCLQLHAVGERLFLSCFRLRECYVVWMLKDYGRGNMWVEVISLVQENYGHSLRPLAYLDNKGQILLYSERVFLWYDVWNKRSKRVSLDVKSDAKYEYRPYKYHTLAYQVSPASLVRLKRSHRGFLCQTRAPERLRLLKTSFGSPEDAYSSSSN